MDFTFDNAVTFDESNWLQRPTPYVEGVGLKKTLNSGKTMTFAFETKGSRGNIFGSQNTRASGRIDFSNASGFSFTVNFNVDISSRDNGDELFANITQNGPYPEYFSLEYSAPKGPGGEYIWGDPKEDKVCGKPTCFRGQACIPNCETNKEADYAVATIYINSYQPPPFDYDIKSLGLGHLNLYACGKRVMNAKLLEDAGLDLDFVNDGQLYLSCDSAKENNVIRVFPERSQSSCHIVLYTDGNLKSKVKDIVCDNSEIGYTIIDDKQIVFACQSVKSGNSQCPWLSSD
ncbi:MAG: hypothetical protein EP298_00920 [Gammaproteobacteria bacterium]|nr:MAG: hypothetical protein EP298_00920 [Gammaproteobacteria bacterium]